MRRKKITIRAQKSAHWLLGRHNFQRSAVQSNNRLKSLTLLTCRASEPDCAFDLDDTNIYRSRRLRRRLQRLTTIEIFRRELRSYQLLESSRAATGSALQGDASSKIKAGVSSAPVRPKNKYTEIS